MKVLHVNEHLAWCGGVETYLLSLIPELERRGHPQAVVFAQGDGTLVGTSYDAPCLSDAGRTADKEGYARLGRILRNESPDVVHLHQTRNVGAIRACLEAAPTVVTGHDYRYLCPTSTFFYRRTEEICQRRCGPGCFATTLTKRCLTPRPVPAVRYYRLVRWFARNAGRIAAVVAPSEYARGRFIEAGFPEDRVVTLPYFCPIEPFAEPRCPPAVSTVLFIGRVRPVKGYRYFIEALGMLPASVQGIMVGDVTPDQADEVRTLAARFGCADRLQVRPWASREEVAGLYCQATVMVFPSIWAETLGIVGLESLACGVPVVASDVGGVREWLHDGKTGFLVRPKDARGLADAVHKVLDAEDTGFMMGQRGISLVQERFSLGSHIARLEAIYKGCQTSKKVNELACTAS